MTDKTLPCGRTECIFRSVQGMIDKMKEDIVARQNIQYPEQVVVAGIYDLTASILSEACRRGFKIRLENCIESGNHKESKVALDTFILLKQLEEDNLVSSEYGSILFNSLIEMEPSIKDQVEKDRELGIL
ncbi:MAG TPA: hypothetical protein VJ343_01380 [archaeon]|nr:hypothetical protein [archaeon]